MEEGAYVSISGRGQAELDMAVSLIERKVIAVQEDVTKLDDFDRIVAVVTAEKGVVNIIVLNAGLTELASVAARTLSNLNVQELHGVNNE